MWEDNEHNKRNGVLKQCQMMSPGSQLDPCHSAGVLLGWPLRCQLHLLCTLFVLQFPPLQSAVFPKSRFFIFFPLPPIWLKRHGEWIGFNSRCLDGLPMQFFKTHFTDTTGAIKDPQRNISIEECLYFALIVHLLWQTSKRGIPALSNAIYRGTRCCDETGRLSCASSPLRMGRNVCGLQNNIIK